MTTTDDLLAAAIESRDPFAFRVLAEWCDEHGLSREATGWRGVADWMESPPTVPKNNWHHHSKYRWPRSIASCVWFYFPHATLQYDAENCLTREVFEMFQRQGATVEAGCCVDFPNVSEAMIALCRVFSALAESVLVKDWP